MKKILRTAFMINKDWLKQNKTVILGTLTVILLVMIIAFTAKLPIFQFTTSSPESKNQTENLPSDESSSASSSMPATAKKASAAKPQPTYEELIEQYAGRRIQFDANCKATPANLNIKTGTSIMFDNRFAGKRTIALAGKNYELSSFGYLILNLKYPTFPYHIQIDCGNGKNTANILIQP